MGVDLRVVGTSETAEAEPPALSAQAPTVPRLLWDWERVVLGTGIPKRTLQKELAAGRFPRPTRQVGRRPYWIPRVIEQWAEGEPTKR
jgi:hypothetical protein